ncbi:hypothetical protein IF1G_10794 [Cordyceps javanica]|uniref:Uncharacterized protein n=1 Tax=Cordyceps javanica TaxID=43265 RepID=A0A545VJF4_9HYPO|nr:hypothetical protein IF1G_10794 [Cordyceps javanica]TQW01852.1 hypothetical protein IF2G_10565 [Cordyceps javanica]
MEDYVLQSTSEFNKTPTPECSYKQKIAEITAQLNQSTARLHEPLSRPGDENTINDIVQIATGELKLYLPYDQAKGEESQSAYSQRGSASPDHSAGSGVGSHPPTQHADAGLTPTTKHDPKLEDSIQSCILSDATRATGKKRRSHEPNNGHKNKLKARKNGSNTIFVFADEREERSVTGQSSASEALEPGFLEHGGAARNDNHIEQSKAPLQIIDSDNHIKGVLEQVGLWGNERVDTILRMPIKRAVRLRQGYDFQQRHLVDICDTSDREGVKIVSCMIQACGETMQQPCLCCEGNKHGPFDTCIMVCNGLFPQCGNCAWDRRLCQGALLAAPTSSTVEADHAPEAVGGIQKPNVPFSKGSHLPGVREKPPLSSEGAPAPMSPDRHSDDAASTATYCDGLSPKDL